MIKSSVSLRTNTIMLLPGPSVAVVTGSNQGIGFQVAKDLVHFYDGTVYLACRNETAGLEAVNTIKSQYVNETIPNRRYFYDKVKFFKVDITKEQEVENFSKHIAKRHGGLDILINNAAVHLDYKSNLTKIEKVNRTLETNYFGILRMCHFLFPLLRQNSRVVHVTSNVGHIAKLNNSELRETFLKRNMTLDELSNLMREYVEDVIHSRDVERGWPDSPYAVSKIAVSKLAMVQQHYSIHNSSWDVAINSVNPGYAKTNMSKNTGLMEPDEAGDAVLCAACLTPYFGPRGQLIWNNKETQEWNATVIRTLNHPSKCDKFWT